MQSTGVATICISLLAFCATSGGQLSADVSFKREIAPLLVRRCLGCHSNQKSEGRYDLHTFAELLKAGDSEESPIVSGKPDESYLLQKLIDTDASSRMPQEDDPLSASQIDTIRQWIMEGAPFDGPSAEQRIATLVTRESHPKPPKVYRQPVATFALRFAPDGRSIITAGVNELLRWDVVSGKLIERIADMPQRIHALRWSPDGKSLAVAGGTPGEFGEIRVVVDGVNRSVTQSEDCFLDVAFSRDSAVLVAGGADNSVRAVDLASCKILWSNRQHVDWVSAMDITDYAFAEELVSNAGAAEFFEFNEGELASGMHSRQHWQFPDSRFIVRKANWELEQVSDSVVGLTKITVTGIGKNYEEKRQVIHSENEKRYAEIVKSLQELHREWGSQVSSTPFVVTASRDRTAKVFGLKSGSLFTTYKGHRREYGPLKGMHRVFGVAVEPESRLVWSGGEGKHFHGWNPITVRDEDGTAADMEERFSKEYSISLLRHDLPAPVFAMARGRTNLLAATADGIVRSFTYRGENAIFDVQKPALYVDYKGQTDQLFAIDYHQESNLIAAAGYRGEVVIWKQGSTIPQTRFLASP